MFAHTLSTLDVGFAELVTCSATFCSTSTTSSLAWPEPELEESSNSALVREDTSELEDPSSDEGQHADLEFSGDSWKLLHGVPREPAPGQVVVMRSYAAGAKEAVIDRDTDLLTPAELQTESARGREAMLT